MPDHSLSEDALATIAFCSEVNVPDGYKALTTYEWSCFAQLLRKNGLRPGQVLRYSKDDWGRLLSLAGDEASELYQDVKRFLTLAGRTTSLGLSISKYQERGINIITRADPEYPFLIKHNLKQECPPLFYVAGTASMFKEEGFKAVGFIGSTQVSSGDLDFVQNLVLKLVRLNYVIVSGGATGLDQEVINTALQAEGRVVLFLADKLVDQFTKVAYTRAMMRRQLVILSTLKPEQIFSQADAWQRYKFIHALSDAMIVTRASAQVQDIAWAEAQECLNNGSIRLLCRQAEYPGNLKLLSQGAFPIDESWDGTMPQTASIPTQACMSIPEDTRLQERSRKQQNNVHYQTGDVVALVTKQQAASSEKVTVHTVVQEISVGTEKIRKTAESVPVEQQSEPQQLQADKPESAVSESAGKSESASNTAESASVKRSQPQDSTAVVSSDDVFELIPETVNTALETKQTKKKRKTAPKSGGRSRKGAKYQYMTGLNGLED